MVTEPLKEKLVLPITEPSLGSLFCYFKVVFGSWFIIPSENSVSKWPWNFIIHGIQNKRPKYWTL